MVVQSDDIFSKIDQSNNPRERLSILSDHALEMKDFDTWASATIELQKMQLRIPDDTRSNEQINQLRAIETETYKTAARDLQLLGRHADAGRMFVNAHLPEHAIAAYRQDGSQESLEHAADSVFENGIKGAPLEFALAQRFNKHNVKDLYRVRIDDLGGKYNFNDLALMEYIHNAAVLHNFAERTGYIDSVATWREGMQFSEIKEKLEYFLTDYSPHINVYGILFYSSHSNDEKIIQSAYDVSSAVADFIGPDITDGPGTSFGYQKHLFRAKLLGEQKDIDYLIENVGKNYTVSGYANIARILIHHGRHDEGLKLATDNLPSSDRKLLELVQEHGQPDQIKHSARATNDPIAYAKAISE